MVKPVSPWLDSKRKHNTAWAIPHPIFFPFSQHLCAVILCKHDGDGYDAAPTTPLHPHPSLPLWFSLSFVCLVNLSLPGRRFGSIQAHCFVAPTISFFCGLWIHEPALIWRCTHTCASLERGMNNGKSRERGKMPRDGSGGVVRQTNDFRPCFQSNPLFVLHDLHS